MADGEPPAGRRWAQPLTPQELVRPTDRGVGGTGMTRQVTWLWTSPFTFLILHPAPEGPDTLRPERETGRGAFPPLLPARPPPHPGCSHSGQPSGLTAGPGQMSFFLPPSQQAHTPAGAVPVLPPWSSSPPPLPSGVGESPCRKSPQFLGKAPRPRQPSQDVSFSSLLHQALFLGPGL